jgi:predicted transcriptional regulator
MAHMPPSRRASDGSSPKASEFSRRERQIMDIVYRLGSATVAEIAARLPDPPTHTAVRTMLRILESKGHLRHTLDGLRHVYIPAVPAEQANRGVLREVVETFFQGSRARAMAALLELRTPLSDEELDRLRALIDRARRRR